MCCRLGEILSDLVGDDRDEKHDCYEVAAKLESDASIDMIGIRLNDDKRLICLKQYHPPRQFCLSN